MWTRTCHTMWWPSPASTTLHRDRDFLSWVKYSKMGPKNENRIFYLNQKEGFRQ
jgi:hypothetical protein